MVDITLVVRAVQALGLPKAFDMALEEVVAVLMEPVSFTPMHVRASRRLAAAAANAAVTPSALLRSLLAANEFTNHPPIPGVPHV